jgi:3-isopropylmalate dehydrogenase
LASLLSFSMLLRYSFDLGDDAKLIETATERVLGSGLRTADIMAPSSKQVSTGEMGDAVLMELDKLAR